jgi:hypothetical protein
MISLSTLIQTTNATSIYYKKIPLSEDVQTYLYCQCMSNDIDFDLMLTLIEQESEFDKYSTSPTGDYGLCQINIEANADLIKKKHINSIYDEFHNIDCAITILSKLKKKYKDTDCVLMCYNMGEDGARKLWNQGIWETSYSLSVKQKTIHYKSIVKHITTMYKSGE